MDMQKVSVWSGVALVALFAGASIWVLRKFGSNWDNVLVVYNAITSIAFTAAGVLLGSKVQQVNLEKASAEASKAKAESSRKSAAMKEAIERLDGQPRLAALNQGGGDAAAEAKAVLLAALAAG